MLHRAEINVYSGTAETPSCSAPRPSTNRLLTFISNFGGKMAKLLLSYSNVDLHIFFCYPLRFNSQLTCKLQGYKFSGICMNSSFHWSPKSWTFIYFQPVLEAKSRFTTFSGFYLQVCYYIHETQFCSTWLNKFLDF